MKKFALVLLVGIFLAGCSTLTEYRKTVTVEKDGDGKIVKTTIVEEIQQPDLKQEVLQAKYLDQ
jgi:uncharacterized protein YceK